MPSQHFLGILDNDDRGLTSDGVIVITSAEWTRFLANHPEAAACFEVSTRGIETEEASYTQASLRLCEKAKQDYPNANTQLLVILSHAVRVVGETRFISLLATGYRTNG